MVVRPHENKNLVVFKQVMGLTVLGAKLYFIYHSSPEVYIHDTARPFNLQGHWKIDGLKWPRGMAASQRHGYIFITDWYRLFRGRLWRATVDMREVNFYPFSIFNFKIIILHNFIDRSPQDNSKSSSRVWVFGP